MIVIPEDHSLVDDESVTGLVESLKRSISVYPVDLSIKMSGVDTGDASLTRKQKTLVDDIKDRAISHYDVLRHLGRAYTAAAKVTGLGQDIGHLGVLVEAGKTSKRQVFHELRIFLPWGKSLNYTWRVARWSSSALEVVSRRFTTNHET